jgi:N-acyl homoserine lactone hydrolase
MKPIAFGLFAAGLCVAAWAQFARPASTGIERHYVLEYGHGTAPDERRFSPGYNDGKPFELSDNCYPARSW